MSAKMNDLVRHWWNWLLTRSYLKPIAFGLVFGFAVGVLVYDVRREWIGDSLLIALEVECKTYMGDRAMLVYHEKRFYCLPERP